MAIPFTDAAVPGFDCLKLEYANEIRSSYSERRQAVGHSAAADWDEGDDGTSLGNWGGIQDWMETYCTQFVNDNNSTYDPAGDSEILMHTLETWQTASFGYGDTFRRVEEWDGNGTPTFLDGKAEEGDIFGYWIYQDIQMGLSKLKWTAKPNVEYNFPEVGVGASSFGHLVCADAIADMQAAYPSTDTRSEGYSVYLGVGNGGTEEDPYWVVEEHKSTADWTITSIPTNNPHTADVYVLPIIRSWPPFIGSPVDFATAADYPSLMPDQLFLLESFPASSDNLHTTITMGNLNEPFGELPYNCANLGSGGNMVRRAHTLLKWDFTYSN